MRGNTNNKGQDEVSGQPSGARGGTREARTEGLRRVERLVDLGLGAVGAEEVEHVLHGELAGALDDAAVEARLGELRLLLLEGQDSGRGTSESVL